MGRSDLAPPEMRSDEICESWLGPLGEQVYWIRRHDERMYWYSGGNPRTAKDVRTRAYFLFGERTDKDPLLTLRAFRDSFQGKRVRKVTCTAVSGLDPKDVGFSEPDGLDRLRTEFFLDNCTTNQQRHNRLSIYMKYDIRFMSKLAIGMAYCLFGDRALRTSYATELYKGLNHKPDEEIPEIQGSSHLDERPDEHFQRIVGGPGSVTVTVAPGPEGVTLNLNIGATMNWAIKCASSENLSAADFASLGVGRVIVLYRQLQRGMELPLHEYIAFKGGRYFHPALAEIKPKLGLYLQYLKTLGA